MAQHEIRIEKARSHNLREVSCSIPLGKLTVVTGVSGCGKSTLAFDTLYAEGQRRYVTSLSTYARQFLERLPRPDVDHISNLPPAIAIEQRNSVTNARSTVGSATELLDHLRILWAALGVSWCPDCDREVEVGSAAAAVAQVEADWDGERCTVAAPIAFESGEGAQAVRARLARAGHTRLLDPEGSVVDVTELPDDALDGALRSHLLVLDRIAVQAGRARRRTAEAAAAAFAEGHGEMVVCGTDGRRRVYRQGRVCDGCGRAFPVPEPALFSYDTPLGACPACNGFGRTAELDWGRVVPDESLSLEADAVAPFSTPMGRELKHELLAACRAEKIDVSAPFESLDERERHFVFEGDEEEGGEWYGVRGYFDWLDGRRYKVQARVLIARYRRFDPCTRCDGMRLSEDARAVRIAGRHLGQIARLTLKALRSWLSEIELTQHEDARTARLMELLLERLDTVLAVGLGYMTLDRTLRTLSGGEAQRIQLATALGGSLTAALYVLDEPSVGLHARDMARLLAVIRAIRDQGNTVVVVEHAPEIVEAADHIIDLGPRAGRLGGQIVVEGNLADLRASPDSLTGRALRGELEPVHRAARKRLGSLKIRGAREHNLQDVDVEIPLGQLVVVTGVSGAGKSSLVLSVLVGNLLGPGSGVEAGACDGIDGTRQLGAVVVVDQKPASRSPRSNPATVSKAFEGIRKRFAATREARAAGVGPGWFSFNVEGGRCDQCEGAGEVVIDMQFMDDLRVPCDECGGNRYRRAALDLRLDGRSIVDVLALTIDEAVGIFADDRKISERLDPLRQVGLGYLTLGQPLSTLSGGENQRVRLAQALTTAAPRTLYVLDEPTTGLHPADIQVLMGCLEKLIEAGGSVVLVEHNLDVIRQADTLIDLGPEGGPEGGRIVAVGTPEQVANVSESRTGAALRGELF